MINFGVLVSTCTARAVKHPPTDLAPGFEYVTIEIKTRDGDDFSLHLHVADGVADPLAAGINSAFQKQFAEAAE